MSRLQQRLNFNKAEPYCVVKSYAHEHTAQEYGFDPVNINMSDYSAYKINDFEKCPPSKIKYIGDEEIIFDKMRVHIRA